MRESNPSHVLQVTVVIFRLFQESDKLGEQSVKLIAACFVLRGGDGAMSVQDVDRFPVLWTKLALILKLLRIAKITHRSSLLQSKTGPLRKAFESHIVSSSAHALVQPGIKNCIASMSPPIAFRDDSLVCLSCIG